MNTLHITEPNERNAIIKARAKSPVQKITKDTVSKVYLDLVGYVHKDIMREFVKGYFNVLEEVLLSGHRINFLNAATLLPHEKPERPVNTNFRKGSVGPIKQITLAKRFTILATASKTHNAVAAVEQEIYPRIDRDVLAELVSKRTGMDIESTDAMHRVFSAMLSHMTVDQVTEIRRFGSFRNKYIAPYLCRNPSTGAKVMSTENNKITFKPCKGLITKITNALLK